MTTQQLTFGISVDVQLRRARKQAQSDPLPREMVEAFYQCKGEVNLLWPMECSHAKAILKGGFTIAQVLACYDYLATDTWYAENEVDITLVTVRKKIAGWVKRGSPSMAPKQDGAIKSNSAAYDRKWAAHAARRDSEADDV